MAHAGQFLESGGKRLSFLVTSAESGGALLSFREHVQPGVPAVPVHLHTRQSEEFHIISGTAVLTIDGVERRLHSGDRATVAPGTAHTYRNGGPGVLHHIVSLRPALDHERFFESVYGLAGDGFSPDRRTLRNLLLAAALFADHHDQLAGVPAVVHRLVFPVLAALARLIGVRAWQPRYAARDAAAGPVVFGSGTDVASESGVTPESAGAGPEDERSVPSWNRHQIR